MSKINFKGAFPQCRQTVIDEPIAAAPAMSAAGKTGELLPMDWACLRYLAENDGAVPTIAIPARMFKGQIPEGTPNLVDMGLIEHRGKITVLTAAGREVLASPSLTTAERSA